MKAVIMAGGEGQRLRPFTNSIPKPLLPLGRKPVAQIILERLRDAGFGEVIMAVGYGADLVRAYFRDGAQFGIPVRYFEETTRLGTAGCLGLIEDLGPEPFLVTNGDILTTLDYASFLRIHGMSRAALTVATRSETVSIPYGVLEVEDGSVRRVEEKPRMPYCFNAGVYAVSPRAVESIRPGEPADMTDVITRLVAAGERVAAYPIEGEWFDLARVDDFERALAQLEASGSDLLG